MQHGLDVVAFFAERKPSVYQAKRWQGFGASDLEEAVDRYTEGRRPFGADRIVIAVATEARDTQTIEKLAELREKHKGMKIELWDRREISDRLRNQTNIVSTFFGPATAAAFCTSTDPPGHVFISYVREDAERADRLQRAFDDAGISVWRDTGDIWPGQDWKLKIRRAITTGSLAFVACFSEHSQARVVSYQNEELILAVEQMRARPPGRVWLLPVRFADCQLPEFDLGSADARLVAAN